MTPIPGPVVPQMLIEKDPNADIVGFRPALRQVVERTHASPDGRVRLVITASATIAARPGPNKTVTFRFASPNDRAAFDSPPAEPFVLAPGESLVLTFRPKLGIVQRPAAGAASKAFARKPSGETDTSFTREVLFDFVDPVSPHHDHNDVHIEC
jgi:hypothetical protein